jgi:hypothetical protein
VSSTHTFKLLIFFDGIVVGLHERMDRCLHQDVDGLRELLSTKAERDAWMPQVIPLLDQKLDKSSFRVRAADVEGLLVCIYFIYICLYLYLYMCIVGVDAAKHSAQEQLPRACRRYS